MAEALYQKIARKKHLHLRYIWGDKETGYVLLSKTKNEEFGRSVSDWRVVCNGKLKGFSKLGSCRLCSVSSAVGPPLL